MRKVAFAGCWHADVRAGIRTIRAVAEAGINTIVHTGDFLYTDPGVKSLLRRLDNECLRNDMTLIVVRGNHDNPDIFRDFVRKTNEYKTADEPQGFAYMADNIVHAPDGLRWTWDGVSFAALGGARSIDWRMREPGVEWWFDEVTSPAAIESVKNAGHTDVLVMHDVPSSVPLHFADRLNMPSWWDLEAAEDHRIPLQEATDAAKPSYVVSGHMHAKQVAQVQRDDYDFTSVILSLSNAFSAPIEDNTCVLTLDNGKVTYSELEY